MEGGFECGNDFWDSAVVVGKNESADDCDLVSECVGRAEVTNEIEIINWFHAIKVEKLKS